MTKLTREFLKSKGFKKLYTIYWSFNDEFELEEIESSLGFFVKLASKSLPRKYHSGLIESESELIELMNKYNLKVR